MQANLRSWLGSRRTPIAVLVLTIGNITSIGLWQWLGVESWWAPPGPWLQCIEFHFKVVDAKTGDPIADATVELTLMYLGRTETRELHTKSDGTAGVYYECWTDRDGVYFPDWTLTAVAPGYWRSEPQHLPTVLGERSDNPDLVRVRRQFALDRIAIPKTD